MQNQSLQKDMILMGLYNVYLAKMQISQLTISNYITIIRIIIRRNEKIIFIK